MFGCPLSLTLFALFLIVYFLYLHSLLNSTAEKKTILCLKLFFPFVVQVQCASHRSGLAVFFYFQCSQTPFIGLVVISNELAEKPNKNYFQLCTQVACVSLCVNTLNRRMLVQFFFFLFFTFLSIDASHSALLLQFYQQTFHFTLNLYKKNVN